MPGAWKMPQTMHASFSQMSTELWVCSLFRLGILYRGFAAQWAICSSCSGFLRVIQTGVLGWINSKRPNKEDSFLLLLECCMLWVENWVRCWGICTITIKAYYLWSAYQSSDGVQRQHLSSQSLYHLSLLILSDKMIEAFWFSCLDTEILLQKQFFNELFLPKKQTKQNSRVMDSAIRVISSDSSCLWWTPPHPPPPAIAACLLAACVRSIREQLRKLGKWVVWKNVLCFFQTL